MAFENFRFFQSNPFEDPLFRSFFEANRPFRRSAGVFPPVNIDDDGESYRVRAEVPGLSRESIDVSVKNDQLTLRGERQLAPAAPGANYHRREREAGTFRRVVTLPVQVDADRIQATYQNGVLEVILPRVPEAKERRIQVH